MTFKGGGSLEKPIYREDCQKRELGQFVDLRGDGGGLCKKEGVGGVFDGV